MSRRAQRESVFKLLFRREFNSDEEMPEQLRLFFEDSEESGNISDEGKEEIEEKYGKIVEHMEEIDKIISDNAQGWTIPRMGKVDLTLIRLAVYEITFDDAVPNLVAIDEAVEIAKKFGGDSSPSFINGVLAKIVNASGESNE
ncbi:MAG: transcription antitermination factor NusB [Lachnospiraceae bacterium]|jgi:N utilization substance protein B|nr:transcription antitermination factor NusB [Lachnospiraceae bacterium]